ncbi:MAG: PhzF family phenazine biosynthesis protein, partial [Acidobacteria bacterium]|nr:PhzF family phenazine biosynthesis protein [Acidobacteriota bacterium]
MADYRYRIVDVFTDQKLEGNPLAVFPEADGLDAGTMQKSCRREIEVFTRNRCRSRARMRAERAAAPAPAPAPRSRVSIAR